MTIINQAKHVISNVCFGLRLKYIGKYENGVLRKLDVKVGDQVLFGKYSGTEVKVNGKDLLVMREEDIMGVLEG